jgi:hypothetical protein
MVIHGTNIELGESEVGELLPDVILAANLIVTTRGPRVDQVHFNFTVTRPRNYMLVLSSMYLCVHIERVADGG